MIVDSINRAGQIADAIILPVIFDFLSEEFHMLCLDFGWMEVGNLCCFFLTQKFL
jgi:hypothetical protein